MAVSRSKKVTVLDILTNNVATQKSVLFLTTRGAENTVDASTNQKFRKAAKEKGLMIQMAEKKV